MDWSRLQHFTDKEAWGDASKMDEDLLIMLDHFRHEVQRPFQVLCGYAKTGHTENSYHYKGRAVDGRFTDDLGHALSLKEQLYFGLISPFGGVGVYAWGAGGPFLHFDNRIGNRKFWFSPQEGVYEALKLAKVEAIFKSPNFLG